MADHGFPDAVVEVVEPARQRLGLGRARGLPQHHDVDEGRRKAGLLHRGLRGAAGAPRRVHGRRHRPVRPARHARHLVRARLRRLPARAADPEHEGRGRRRARCGRSREEACDLVRRFKGSHSGEHGDGISRSEFHERMFGPRLVSAFEEVKDAFDPTNGLNPSQDRPPAPDGRPHADALSARITRSRSRRRPRSTGRNGAASAVRSRCATTTAPAGRSPAGTMCPSYRATPRRAACDARPGELAAARDLRPARAGRLHVAGDEGDARPLRLVQGLPARMPDGRRHGPHEDRVPAPLSRAAWAAAEGPADRASAALCAGRRDGWRRS